MKKYIIILTLSCIGFFAFGQEKLSNDDNISTVLKKTRKYAAIPAIAVAVIKDGKIVLTAADGLIKMDGDDTVSLESKFHLGSNTKAITSFIAGKLVEEGKIKWDDKLINALPDYKDKILDDYRDVTFEMLLSHRAKIRPYTSGAEFLKLDKWKGTISERRLAFTKFVLSQKPTIDPSKTFNYSNAGYAIAAFMMENATGKSWEDLVKETMTNLKLQYTLGFPNRQDANQPWGHMAGVAGMQSTGPNHAYKLEDFVASAGDVSMNITDYANFVLLHQQGLLGSDNYLKSETYQKIHFGLPEYAFGWGNQQANEQKVSYHDGSAGTFYCHAIMNTTAKLSIIIMANVADKKGIEGIYGLQQFLGNKFEK